MWKYVSRRIRDTFERSVNNFDRRSTTGVVNNCNFTEEENKQTSPCKWFCARKCWNEFKYDNDTNSKRWNFEDLHRSWIGAITWSSALVLGWYASQLIHLKHKYGVRDKKNVSCQYISYILASKPCLSNLNKNDFCLKHSQITEKVINSFIPTVHLVSNEPSGLQAEASSSTTSSDTASSDSDLGEVLNSIENSLGMAAIKNGQHRDGLNLLRSAANRQHAPALYNLGLCYEMGFGGVNVDEKIAMEFYKSAAALKHAPSLYNLGIFYAQGRGGLGIDTEVAARLLRLAAVQGQKEAVEALKFLDIDTTERLPQNATSWFSQTPFLNDSIVPTHSTMFVENVQFVPSH